MRISHEVPISLLEQSLAYNDYDYCLVHLLETHPVYKEHYIRARTRFERDVLLDNSIFELGTAFDPQKFAKYIEELRPSYYVIPDVLENAQETMQSFEKFVKDYPDLPGVKIGVVQGKTFNDVVECYKFMSDKADYIAISFDYSLYQHGFGIGRTKLERQCTGRVNLIRLLVNLGIWNTNKPHHLLGCSLAREFKEYDKFVDIYSCDTSNPIVAGIEGFTYSGTFGLNVKPKTKLVEYIDLKLNQDQWDRVNYNVKQFRVMCNG